MECNVEFKRGDIIVAQIPSIKSNLEENEVSNVQRGYRPLLVIGEKVTLHHPLLVVCAITKMKKSNYPFIQPVQLNKLSYIHYEQIFTIDKKPYRVIAKLSNAEKQEMELKCSYCIGGARTNVLNIEGISRIMKIGDTITGMLRYRLGEDQAFSVSDCAYRNTFGPPGGIEDISEKLSSIEGIKLLISEGGVIC